MSAQQLQVRRFPLRGSHLIEASAGTGKTWTIAALYVRLVLGHGEADARPLRPLMPPDILVMTFTRAATRELSDRIRARLAEAAQVFRGTVAAEEGFLKELLADYPEGEAREQAAHRLALAAQAMAVPCLPEERLPMNRTGSMGSRVPPAVTSTRRPSRGRLRWLTARRRWCGRSGTPAGACRARAAPPPRCRA